MHWPCPVDPEDLDKASPDWSFNKTWYVKTFVWMHIPTNESMNRLAMQDLPHGKVKNIGVANFDIHNLDILLSDPSVKTIPSVNQIELHPYNATPKLVSHCRKLGIQCLGYSPLGSKNSLVIREPVLSEIAERNRRTPQQILLMWGLQSGWGVIPGSLDKKHVASNFDLDGWSLAECDLTQLSNCETRQRIYTDLQRMRLPSRVFHDEEVRNHFQTVIAITTNKSVRIQT